MSILFVINTMEINSTTTQESKFLKGIDTIAKAPRKLYFTGVLPTHIIPTVAIVGTRKPTTYGVEIAHAFAYTLASRGIAIISGLALGIDAIAHRAALEANGRTIAVLANGLDRIYPRSHTQLGRRIVAQGGAIISEYPASTPPYPSQFLARNRIISGLSQAIVIIEAAARSGTLNTATHALEQGKEVFVVPGNITSPMSQGCNKLIKQGAHPATCVEDILEVIAPQPTKIQPIQQKLGDTAEEEKILALLRAGIRQGDELHKKSGLAISEFSQTLTLLEIKGSIRALGAHQWMLK
ncbi:MAG TPA: DNA-processing protein DprA [Candidatus Saccharimonadales bacterium]